MQRLYEFEHCALHWGQKGWDPSPGKPETVVLVNGEIMQRFNLLVSPCMHRKRREEWMRCARGTYIGKLEGQLVTILEPSCMEG